MKSSHAITTWLFESLGLMGACMGISERNVRGDAQRFGIGNKS